MEPDVRLVNLGVVEDLLNKFKSTVEEILAADLFETGMSEGSVEIDMDVWVAEGKAHSACLQAVRGR